MKLNLTCFTYVQVTVKSGCNPAKVKVHGDGLEKGIVDEHNQFVIETRNAGTGGLGLAMEGPNEAVVQVAINIQSNASPSSTDCATSEFFQRWRCK